MPKKRTADHAKLIKRIDKLGERWQSRVGLDHIEIGHHYLDAASDLLLGADPKNRPGTMRCSFGQGGGSLSYTAFVETRWNYQLADVYFLLPAMLMWSPERQEQVVLHEYCHIFLASEQYLLEDRLGELAAEEEMKSTDMDLVAKLYYERMEMATENACRAIWAAWAE